MGERGLSKTFWHSSEKEKIRKRNIYYLTIDISNSNERDERGLEFCNLFLVLS